MPPKTLVTVATYNERENLPALIEAILAVQPEVHVLVIDDSSPDGTGELAEHMASRDGRIRVQHRPGKLGLGTALITAMRYAMEQDYELMLNLDADFSHHPRYIPALLAGMGRYDVMVGSRYVPGGGVANWPLPRRLMSAAINAYARVLLGLPVRDTSGAFRCYRVDCLKRLDLSRILSRGYSFQEEILFRCCRVGCRMAETPIVFEERRHGASKIDRWEAVAAVAIILWLGLGRMFGWA